MIILLVKAPTGFTLALPAPLEDGTSTATPEQMAISDAINSVSAEWGQPVGVSGTDTLWRVVTRATDLSQIEGMISAYSLPLTILHAQDAYESDTGNTITVEGMQQPVMATVVHTQGATADILDFIPDAVVYDVVTMKETSRTPATIITLPNCSDFAAWQI